MQLLLCALLVLTLILSVITDVKYRRILNPVTLPALFVAILLHMANGGGDGVIFALKGLGFGFICFIVPYLMGIIGAGDVKLMSVVGAVVGYEHTLFALFFIAVSGGILAVVLLMSRRVLRRSLTRIWLFFVYLVATQDASIMKSSKDELSQEGMPFAVAIAAGIFLYIIYVWRTTGMLPVLGPS